ncbi:molybdenum cofactor biosynthesis protein MoeB [Bryobacterales bacterium F-183]|nr:molybdenum cofactor biosynthesis protein MoeB [Bryobacterales bacterium F-183]
MALTNQEIARYSRHLILPEVGMEGQNKLKNASVLLIGTGGLGAPSALYLAASGIGRIGLVDFDVVDESNLQRQIIHGTKDIGRKKLHSARDSMHDINPYMQIDLFEEALESSNAMRILKDYDIVLDGTDNFPTRYLTNDACVLSGKPNVYGSIFRFEGQSTVFATKDGPCYRCLYPEPPPPGLVPSCAEGGVMGVLPGIIGVIQATETVKLILGAGNPLIGRLLLYDALGMKFRELKIRKDPNCPICGPNKTITELIDYHQFCGIPSTPPPPPPASAEVEPLVVKQWLSEGRKFTFIDVREPHEYQIARIEGTQLLPLGEVPKRLGEFDKNAEIVVHCKSGMRSAKAQKAMQEAGFTNVLNMKGGILAWSDKVDPKIPKY